MSETMWQVTITAPQQAELLEQAFDASELGPTEVMGRTLASLISAGTELACCYTPRKFLCLSRLRGGVRGGSGRRRSHRPRSRRSCLQHAAAHFAPARKARIRRARPARAFLREGDLRAHDGREHEHAHHHPGPPARAGLRGGAGARRPLRGTNLPAAAATRSPASISFPPAARMRWPTACRPSPSISPSAAIRSSARWRWWWNVPATSKR